MGKRKAPSGTWLLRDITFSRAFFALNSNAKLILLLFLHKRNMNRKHECINKSELTMTYLELEYLHGKTGDGKPIGLSRSSIARAFDDLMAKGFIGVVKRGGTYKKDKTIYFLSDEWKGWWDGQVKKKRVKGTGAGSAALKI